jgi:hypothetical protein
MSQEAIPGPGSRRVGRFIGRLGVVSINAVQVGLDLGQRVVRRHVAKLEAMRWLAREPWIWGERSVAWLTAAGIESAGLGGIRAVKAPPGATTIAHGVLVGWSAARVEHRDTSRPETPAGPCVARVPSLCQRSWERAVSGRNRCLRN